MALTILNQTRRLSWSFIASAGLHASLVAGLLYATVPPMNVPSAVEQPITVMLMAPESQQAPKVALQSVSESEPEPQAPVQVPKQKPKPKPEGSREIKPQPPKPETHPVAPAPSKPASSSVKSVSNAPRAVLRTHPLYPPQARALGIEGRVSVMFDVNTDGRVENVRIVSAQSRKMFERDIRFAMSRWTYETGKPATDITVNFKFDLEGVNSGE